MTVASNASNLQPDPSPVLMLLTQGIPSPHPLCLSAIVVLEKGTRSGGKKGRKRREDGMEEKMGVGATHSREAEEAAKRKTEPPSPRSFPATPKTKSYIKHSTD